MKKGTIKKISCILLILANLFLLAACEKKSVPPTIVVGRECNHQVNRVADTASSFTLKDPVVFELVSETHFEFTEMECIVYEGTIKNRGPEKWRRQVKTTPNQNTYAVRGKARKGGFMSAKELFRLKKEGFVTIEFKTKDSVIAIKEIEVRK
jgi:hypothetical protein